MENKLNKLNQTRQFNQMLNVRKVIIKMNVGKLKLIYETKLKELGFNYRIDGDAILFQFLGREYFINLNLDVRTLNQNNRINPVQLFSDQLNRGDYDNFEEDKIYPVVLNHIEANDFEKMFPGALIEKFEYNLKIAYLMERTRGKETGICVKQNNYSFNIRRKAFDNLNNIIRDKIEDTLVNDIFGIGLYQLVGYRGYESAALFTPRLKKL